MGSGEGAGALTAAEADLGAAGGTSRESVGSVAATGRAVTDSAAVGCMLVDGGAVSASGGRLIVEADASDGTGAGRRRGVASSAKRSDAAFVRAKPSA